MNRTFRGGGVVRLGVVLLLVAGFLTWQGYGTRAQAADAWSFQAGNIISDDVFFNPGTMSAGDVQTFLVAKNPSCVPGSDGTPCLKDYRQDTWTRAADGICAGTYVGGAQESAATIISKVAQACGINPQVLLVMLQKEQGLVTDSGGTLYATRYRSAMGMGCPDTAVCDSQYYGFYNQVYGAAHQMQRYATYPANYGYQAGRNNTILYSPKGAAICGSSSVYIQNQATAGLYNYTPYQPNNAALAAGYGTGDGCSAYGNRNFYLYFTDWFGTTGAYAVSGAIGALWTATGGGDGYLGYPATAQFCGLAQGGCGQHFQKGSVYWSPGTGAHGVSGSIRYLWASLGWENSWLGYPTTEQDCSLPGGGCTQSFQGGQVLWSSSYGSIAMHPSTVQAWTAAGGVTGPLGYPTAAQVCILVNGGCRQDFQGGAVYETAATGAHAIMQSSPVGAYWLARWGETGPFGYPVGDQVCDANGCYQPFQNAQIASTAAYGLRVVSADIGKRWAAEGFAASPVGWPVADMVCGLTAGGCRQDFQNGSMYSSPSTGAWPVTGALGASWKQGGADASGIGYPTSEMSCTAAGCSQSFQRGLLTWTTANGVHWVNGAIAARWVALGGGSSPLGYLVDDAVCGLVSGGCRADFQNGSIYWSPTSGVGSVTGDLGTYWKQHGAEAGSAGYPTGDTECTSTGCTQQFQNARLAGTTATGYYTISGAIGSTWTSMAAYRGVFGYPVADMTCDAKGCSQKTQNGYLGWTSAGGVRFVNATITQGWASAGGGSGPLGYPTGDGACGLAAGGCLQQFQGGAVVWSPSSGAHGVAAAIGSIWLSHGADRSVFGYPIGEMSCDSNGCAQKFQNGYLGWTATNGVHFVNGGFADGWVASGTGAGPLQYPVADGVCGLSGGGCRQQFQGGSVVWTAATGAHAVSGAIGAVWTRNGADRSPYGYPTADVSCDAAGCVQQFQNGYLGWTPLNGVHFVNGPLVGAYTAAGAGTGSLGYPIGDGTLMPGGLYQDFQNGRLIYQSATQTVTRS